MILYHCIILLLLSLWLNPIIAYKIKSMPTVNSFSLVLLFIINLSSGTEFDVWVFSLIMSKPNGACTCCDSSYCYWSVKVCNLKMRLSPLLRKEVQKCYGNTICVRFVVCFNIMVLHFIVFNNRMGNTVKPQLSLLSGWQSVIKLLGT
mgnify:FL=1